MITRTVYYFGMISQLHRMAVTQGILAGIILCNSGASIRCFLWTPFGSWIYLQEVSGNYFSTCTHICYIKNCFRMICVVISGLTVFRLCPTGGLLTGGTLKSKGIKKKQGLEGQGNHSNVLRASQSPLEKGPGRIVPCFFLFRRTLWPLNGWNKDKSATVKRRPQEGYGQHFIVFCRAWSEVVTKLSEGVERCWHIRDRLPSRCDRSFCCWCPPHRRQCLANG